MWRPKYYILKIYSDTKLNEKLAYMHNNPVKAGLVNEAKAWQFGSARYYLLGKSVGVPITAIC
jgi:putative transposase